MHKYQNYLPYISCWVSSNGFWGLKICTNAWHQNFFTLFGEQIELTLLMALVTSTRLCVSVAQILHRYWTEIVQILHRYYEDIAQILWRYRTDIVKILHRYCEDIAEILWRYCTDIAQREGHHIPQFASVTLVRLACRSCHFLNVLSGEFYMG